MTSPSHILSAGRMREAIVQRISVAVFVAAGTVIRGSGAEARATVEPDPYARSR